ncbi:anhydro-N-acetylmuramic acid kinase [Flavobacterium rivuli WB 3.3-2 = DSM 21788]|uniref:Anhydro-N-acetylmuramic acid kinase n=1 Tax=Flavobacterium rivuli WB 3.3-2 = DSM 21788 TaxID=1121895 RepID=A0A0A2M303_9FLAO|nr:anhydro-N-acetylmuramic acid kinase [Flavobacterium rivuli]KGO86001.1 anhydro-N-acetylmuramic acid kinase [Flavobacterium rivuli WB 3.3-2 = DSM 21788]
MITQSYNVVGVMSGTSLDGADLAHIKLTVANGVWQYHIYGAETIAYTNEWVNKLKTAIDYNEEELKALNNDYTILLSSFINDFIVRHDLTDLDAVCSHGHTILHRPQDGVTLQIGNLPQIAALTGQKIVCDFRVADVALGGQGAPLVPIGDRLLFANYNYCLNLGGFSNISFEENGIRLAFDICPVNTVLNFYANKLGLDYDDAGAVAAGGIINKELLTALNSLNFYTAPYPKSLGFEFVKQTVLPLVEKYNDTPQNNLATFTEHVAVQIANVILQKGIAGSLFITGGGAYNKTLINRMRQLMPQLSIVVPDDKTIQYKEALIFALLGVLKLRGEVNVLGSVTGAPKDHISGVIYSV